MALKGNTLTVDNRKSLLFLYSEGTIKHKTWYVSSRKEIQVDFSALCGYPSPGTLGQLEVVNAASRLAHISTEPAYASSLVATSLLVTLTSSTERDLCPQEYSHPLPPLP